MTSISLEPFTHNSKGCIAIKFPYNFETKEYIKNFDGVYWTKTHRTFYIFFNEVRLDDLKGYIKKGGLNLLEHSSKDVIPRYSKGIKIELEPLNEEKTKVYRHFLEFLRGERFSDSTIATYSGFILEFLRFREQKPVNDLNENDVRHYIEWAVNTLNYAVSTHRQMVSASPENPLGFSCGVLYF